MEPQANNNDPAQKSPAILPLPSRKNSSLIIVFSLLLLGLISSIAYLVYQNNLLREEITSLKTQTGDNLLTPTPTIDLSSDLKSYADQEEKFEIKYPSDWTIGDLTVINTETNIKSMSIFPPSSIDAMAINIHVYKIDNFILPITKYIEKQKQECLDFMENELIKKVVQNFVKQDKIIGAICAAPRLLLHWQILTGKNMTGWNGDKKLPTLSKIGKATYTGEAVTVDQKIVTADGPDSAEMFAQALWKLL